MPSRAEKTISKSDWYVFFNEHASHSQLKSDIRKGCRESGGRVNVAATYQHSLVLRWQNPIKYDTAMSFLKKCTDGSADFKLMVGEKADDLMGASIAKKEVVASTIDEVASTSPQSAKVVAPGTDAVEATACESTRAGNDANLIGVDLGRTLSSWPNLAAIKLSALLAQDLVLYS